jgi:uncharacterized protein YdhG (YjbR/CyaY superfamily)
MKKSPPRRHNAKPLPGPKAVDAYLAAAPEPHRSTLKKIRATTRANAPREATEQISYGMPAFRYKGPLIGYAAFKEHCSIFPMNSSTIVTLKNELKNFPTAKGTIRFPADKPFPTPLLKKLLKLRIAQNDAKYPPLRQGPPRRP